MEEELRSEIETLKDISEGAVPPEISIGEAKAILKQYKDLKRANSDLQGEQEQLYDKLDKLEEENAMLKKANNITEDVTVEDITQVINKSLEEFKREFIPTSVIQNKIDELYKKQDEKDNKLSDLGFDLGTRNYLTLTEHKIQLLRELLEEGRK